MTWLTGPIAITGANGQVGRALQRRLATLPNDVRPLGRGDDLAAAFRDAEVVIHLAGTLRPQPPNTYADANVRTVERMVAALAGSSVTRVVFLSYVGADPTSSNEYLRTKGEAEDLLYRCGRDAVIFRCSHIYGPPHDPGPTAAAFLAQKGGPARILGSGKQRIAAVYRGDVVEAILKAALDPRAPHGRFDLTGPEVTTVDEFARTINSDGARLAHVPPLLARALGHVFPNLTPALVEVLLADSVGDCERARRAFVLDLHRVAEVYRAPDRAAAA